MESGLPLEEGEGLQDAAAESPGELPPPLHKPLKNLSTTFWHDTGCLGLVHWDDPEGRQKK